MPINLPTTKLFIFINRLFINNKDFSSQIGYKIIIINKTKTIEEEFEIKGNLIYYSSTKSKQVIRSVLVLEIYGIIGGVNIAIIINITLKIITD